MPRAGDTLRELLRGDDGAAALVHADDGVRVSYGRLADDIDVAARALSGSGVRRGDCVAMVVPDGPVMVRVLLAVTALGAAAAPLNPAYTRDELRFYLDDLAPAALIVPAGEVAAAREAAGPAVRVVETSNGTFAGRRVPGYEPAKADDVALLLHTSGTTSRPKQVPLLHRNLTASARSIAEFYALGPDDVSYCMMPLFHVHGLVASAFAAFAAGGSVIVPRRFLPRRMWRQISEFGATWLSAGPTLHAMALDRRGRMSAPASLRFARSCSSALSPALLERCEDEYGVPMLEAYGMTEASHQMTSNPLPPAARVVGSVGISAGAEIRILDERGRDAEVGEVAIQGPGVMSGYLANADANAAAFVDGWFRTGDRGRIRDGYLHLEGRIKELIIRGGENISPGEIEDALRSHFAVVDAVAFGIESEKYGEEVGAAVALRETVEVVALRDHCRERLAAYKVPVRIFVLPEIPRTPTGKLQRRRIAERLLA
jgi:acyl-CoA synthetase (AMP-forming)/AMP-acid ligase II